MIIGSQEWKEWTKQDPKQDPIILVYADGSVETRHHNVTKGRIAMKGINKTRPVLILYPECVTDPVLLDIMKMNVKPVGGQCLMYTPPKFVGEDDE